jgi:sugar phosphate permease
MGRAFQWKSRYTVLSILFITWIVSFMDRTIMSVAIPFIAGDFHLSPLAMGGVMSAFFASYAISQIPGGLLADKFGVRGVGTVALLWWSTFTAITGAAANLTQMLIARLGFGFGEGVFPACGFKTIAAWFPQKERATANSIMLSSSAFGAALAPLVVVRIVATWGWRPVFYSLFVPGLMTAFLFWIFVTNKPSKSSRVSPEELAEIEGFSAAGNQDPQTKVSLLAVFKDPNVLKCFFVLFAFDIAYWGFSTWLPTYLLRARGFSMAQMGIAASLPNFAGAIGCIIGGLLSDKLFSNSRRVPIVASQLTSALLLYMTLTADSAEMLVLYQTLAGFCLTFFFSVFWALPMNTVPKRLMGVTSGVINMAGQIAAFLSPIIVGYLVGADKGKYNFAFMLLIGSLLVSCAIVFTLPNNFRDPEEARDHG